MGLTGDVPIPSDYDGDGATDLAVFRPSNSQWYMLTSGSGFTAATSVLLGEPGDTPVVGDFDGDRRADLTVFRPSTGTWSILPSSTNYTRPVFYQWGLAGDVPVPGDYDGDGIIDLAVYRGSTGMWLIRLSSTGFATSASFSSWGSTATPVPGDYDGERQKPISPSIVVSLLGLGDQPSTGVWFVALSSTGYTTSTRHHVGASPATSRCPGDFDGDGRIGRRRLPAIEWLVAVSAIRPTLRGWREQSRPVGIAGRHSDPSASVVCSAATMDTLFLPGSYVRITSADQLDGPLFERLKPLLRATGGPSRCRRRRRPRAT